MADIHILRQKIATSAERQASAALQASLIDEIMHSTSKIFLEMLNTEVTAKISKRMIKSADEIIDAMTTSQYNVLRMRDHNGLVGLNSKFIDTVVNGLTGAPNAAAGDVQRACTPTDIALSAVIYNAILVDVFYAPMELQGKETEKAPLIFLLPEDRYAFLNIEILNGEQTSLGNFELMLPLPCVEAFAAPNASLPDEHQIWQDHMLLIAEDALLELDSVIQRIPVSLDTILNLKIGDSLDVSDGSLDHLEMAASTLNGQHVIFKGQLGSLKTHKAFRVTSLTTLYDV